MPLFKDKMKIGTVIDVNVRFTQDILPMLVVYGLFFCDAVSTQSKIAPLQNVNGLKALFLVKAMHCHLGYGRILLSM